MQDGRAIAKPIKALRRRKLMVGLAEPVILLANGGTRCDHIAAACIPFATDLPTLRRRVNLVGMSHKIATYLDVDRSALS